MYLKKIEVFGFKSFADKTEIVFERGVTCVVGPNGCGKSNISDSIRWVLGERSAKLLRGSKMEDVIFAGTEFRKPLNLAEVSLTIDNTDQKLPIQYEEAVITRRLHRSGESEYLLNRTPCRLKDIQDVILDTGIGSNSYSMIEQGRIDHILNAEAEERRFLIEEAAGISKYKVKKEEALRKLERTEQNLLRLNDITSEVERNIRYAERQAQRAERYKEQFERLKSLEIKNAFFEINLINEQLSNLNRERDEKQEIFSNLEEKSAKYSASTREIDERLHQSEIAFFAEENARSEAKQEFSMLQSQERFHQEKIDFLKLAAEKALGEIEALNKRSASLTSELEIKEREKTELSLQLSQFQNEKSELESKVTSLKEDVTSEAEINRQQTVLFDLARQLSDLRNSIHKIQGELIVCERTKANLIETRKKLIDTKESYSLRHENIDEKRTDYEKQRAHSETKLSETVRNRQELEKTLEELKIKHAQIKSNKAHLEGKIKLLEELNYAYGTDPKKIAAHHDTFLKGATKTFLDAIQIEPGYELAAEAALWEALNAVVTDNVETAAHLLKHLKESGFKQATIFIKQDSSSNGFPTQNGEIDLHPLIKNRLWDVIKVKDDCSAMLSHLIGHVYIIDELTPENVYELAPIAQNYKLVTKSGTIFGPHLQITLRNGGYTPERSTFARREELVKLVEEVGRAEVLESETDRLIKNREAEIKEIKVQEQFLNGGILELHSSLKHHEGTLMSVSEYVSQIDDEIQLVTKDMKSNEDDAAQFANQLESLNKQLIELELQEQKEREYLRSVEERLENYHNIKSGFENELLQINSKIGLTIDKQASLQKTADFLNNQLTENTNQVSSLTAERNRSFQQIGQLQIELTGFASQKEAVEKRLFEHSVCVERLKQERAEVAALRNQVAGDAQIVARELESVRQNFHAFSLKEMEFNHQSDSIAQGLQSRYKINLSILSATDFLLAAEDVEESRAEIEKLREKLDAIGTVNLLAIDEYQELKERYDLLLTQKNDLTESKEALLEAIRKINRTTKRLFEETLAKVRESFREYFRVLFGGGYADLVLVDEQNPFESGLDIVARPPGKKPQHITLLSGGEKALTAIALLLSLFSVKPSPFCVLDEVDAPLDEANNDRFLQVLKPFLETTQFIIVTHSRKTIAVGDALYGVTMQEPGVSKLVSVKLAHNNGTLEHSDSKVASELNQILT